MGEGDKISLKDYWQSVSERVVSASYVADEKIKVAKERTAVAAKKAAEKTSEVMKDATEKTSSAAKKAAEKTSTLAQKSTEKGSKLTEQVKDAIHERATRPNPKAAELEPLHGVLPLEPILPPLERMAEKEGKVVIPITEYEQMCDSVARLQESEAQSAELIDKIANLESLNHELHVEKREGGWSLVSRRGEVLELSRTVNEPPEKLTQEVGKSLRETTTILWVSVVWLAGLTAADYSLKNDLLTIPELPFAVDIALWSVGTGAWSLFVLWRLKKARTFLSMPVGMRIQTSIGVGLATAMAILLMQEQKVALQNVWGWSATIALSALLLSGFVRGLWGSARRIGRLDKGRRKVIDVEPISDN